MKSRREMLANFLVDITKAIFIASVIGAILQGGLTSLPIALGAIIICTQIITVAWAIHPKSEVDKEKIEIWKQF